MKRRTLLRRIGATGIATMAFATPSAARRPISAVSDIDREIDVSSISGHVTLPELLDDDELARVPDAVELDRRTFTIAEEADTITLDDCCFYCAGPPPCVPLYCDCFCCEASCYDC